MNGTLVIYVRNRHVQAFRVAMEADSLEDMTTLIRQTIAMLRAGLARKKRAAYSDAILDNGEEVVIQRFHDMERRSRFGSRQEHGPGSDHAAWGCVCDRCMMRQT